MPLPNILHEQWWLMTCDFPDLNWARLRVHQDGSADVFDSDGRTLHFPLAEDALHYLNEDEYSALEDIEEDEHIVLSQIWNDITPPVAATDTELMPQMLRRIAHKAQS